MTAVAGAVAPVAIEPAVPCSTAVTRSAGRRHSILNVLLGMAQYGSILDAGVLKTLMEAHGYSIPPAQEEMS